MKGMYPSWVVTSLLLKHQKLQTSRSTGSWHRCRQSWLKAPSFPISHCHAAIKTVTPGMLPSSVRRTPPDTPTHPNRPHPPLAPTSLESLCMVLSLFPQPIEVKITVGCERAEWLYISKITLGIYHCHRDTPTGMNWVKWEQCIGQGALTVTNAPPVATNRSVQIAGGL